MCFLRDADEQTRNTQENYRSSSEKLTKTLSSLADAQRIEGAVDETEYKATSYYYLLTHCFLSVEQDLVNATRIVVCCVLATKVCICCMICSSTPISHATHQLHLGTSVPPVRDQAAYQASEAFFLSVFLLSSFLRILFLLVWILFLFNWIQELDASFKFYLIYSRCTQNVNGLQVNAVYSWWVQWKVAQYSITTSDENHQTTTLICCPSTCVLNPKFHCLPISLRLKIGKVIRISASWTKQKERQKDRYATHAYDKFDPYKYNF